MNFKLRPHCGSIVLFLLIALFSSSAYAQTGEISGKIKDEKGAPLPGVTVLAPKSGKSVVSKTDGSFKVPVTAADDSLTFSYIGYTTSTVATDGKTSINISLSQVGSTLSDVVVVGYGTQKKRAVTGAVVSVGYEQFKDRSFSNVTQALAGQVPGVNISQAQGAPGVSPIIRIRGVSSITAGTNPLFVVDGVPLENFNLNLINPQDIESVEILKDASSAAIYGSRGASGVIIVTTKIGKSGKSTVSASYEYGMSEVIRKVKMMDAQQWIDYYKDAKNNAWVDLGGGHLATDPNSVRTTNYKIPEDFTTNPAQFGKGTDWQDVMFRKAPSHNGQVSISGGSEKTQFLFSVGMLKQDAVLDNNYYNRLAIRSNLKHKISDKFNIGVNLGLTGIENRTEGTEGKSDVISLGLQSDPIFPEYNEKGTLGFRDPSSVWYRFISYNDMNLWHPYSLTRFYEKKNKTFNALGTAFLEYHIAQGLKFRSSISGNMSYGKLDSYRYKNQGFGYSSLLGSEASSNGNYMFNWLTENTINYEKHFGEHNISALAGYTTQKQRDETNSATGTGFPNDLVPTLNAATAFVASTFATEWSLVSYLARVNYDFKSKYYMSLTVRRDGSSRFGENAKWGYFPSVSAGWVASDESFLSGSKVINFLKLRASLGVAGNNQIPNYGAISLLGASNANYASGGTLLNGQSITTIENKDLKWEKTTQFNVGVDMRLFNNRVNLTLEYYNSTTKDMLLNVPVPDVTGFSSQLTNIGRMRNTGVEVNLSTKNIATKAFSWTTDFNLSANRNKVLQLGPGNAPILYTDFAVTVKTEVGQPISNFYGYVFDGVYLNQAQIDKSAHDATTRPGDPIVRDVNKDGKITADDRTTLGNYQPDFIAGITNTLNYKNFDFSFMLQGSFGGEITNQNVRYLGWWNNGRNMYEGVDKRWRSESNPGDGTHFRATLANTGLMSQYSSYWVEDASYIKIKNIRISYTLPASLLARTPFKNTRVYVNAENVHLFSKYLLYDPENTTYNATSYSGGSTGNAPSGINAPSSAFIGVDYGSYPSPRTITFGIKTDF